MQRLIVVLVVIALVCCAQSSRGAATTGPPAACSCPPVSEAQTGNATGTAEKKPPRLASASAQQYVLIKVRMFPAAASALLGTVKADVTGSKGPEPWVAALVNSTTKATAKQLGVPTSALHVTLEASLGSGLSVPMAPSNRQQAAVDALAEFYETVTGSTSLLVGLNMVPTSGLKPRAPSTSTNLTSSSLQDSKQAVAAPASGAAGGAATMLALATLNAPFGDLADVLHLANTMQHRCEELFHLGAVLDLSSGDNATCAAWLADWYLPVLHETRGAGQDGKAAAMPAAAAALKAAGVRADGDAHHHQAMVALPMQVNIKLSMKLALPAGSADPDALISSARSYLQSQALDQVLQQHGLRIGAGSPAHLVTLMGPASDGDSSLDRVIEVEGGLPAAAAGTDTDAAGTDRHHHEVQSELGHARSGGAYSVPGGVSAWGGLAPHEMEPIVPVGQGGVPGALTTAGLRATGGGSASGSHAAEDDEIGRRTVLGAIIGAVLGSAAAGAGLALFLTSVARRRRAAQQSLNAAGGSTCGDASSRPNGDPARASSSGGRRRRSRKRYSKYLPSMSAQHLLPVTAPPGSPGAAGFSPGATAPRGDGSAWNSAALSPAVAAGGSGLQGAGQPPLQQPLHYDAAVCEGAGAEQAAAAAAAAAGYAAAHDTALPAASSARAPLQTSSAGAGVPAGPPQPHQAGRLPQVVQQQQQVQDPQPASAMQPLQQPHMHSRVRSRLMDGLALLRSAASDPLAQPPNRRPIARRHSGGLWAPGAVGGGASSADGGAAVTRQELCSDSVSSAARMDLLQSLQRSGSAGSSEGGSSLGAGTGSAAPSVAGSSRPASPDDVQGFAQARAAPTAPNGPSYSRGQPSAAQQVSSGGMGAQRAAAAASLPLAGLAYLGNERGSGLSVSGQQPPTAWSHPCGSSVAAAHAQQQQHNAGGSLLQDGNISASSSSVLPAGVCSQAAPTGAAQEARSSTIVDSGGRDAATGRPALRASPFLHYDFAALEQMQG